MCVRENQILCVYVSNKLNRLNCEHSLMAKFGSRNDVSSSLFLWSHQTEVFKSMPYRKSHLVFANKMCFLLHFNVEQINNLFAYFDTVKINFWGDFRENRESECSANLCVCVSKGGLIQPKTANYNDGIMNAVMQTTTEERERADHKSAVSQRKYVCKYGETENRTKDNQMYFICI